MKFHHLTALLALICPIAVAQTAAPTQTTLFPKDTGYRGIWYPNQATHDQYVWKYSGGLGTYPQQQEPIAIYAPKVLSLIHI